MNTTLVTGGIELAKLILQSYFACMRQQGKTEEEISQLFNQESNQFHQNTPDQLDDPE